MDWKSPIASRAATSSGTLISIAATKTASDFAKSLRAADINRAITLADGVRARPHWLAFSANRLPDLPYRPADSIKKRPAGILHQMPTVGDLLRIRQGLRDGLAVAATPVASDDRYRLMLGKP